jgi:hypothetical protein
MVGHTPDRIRRGLFLLGWVGLLLFSAGCGSPTQPVDGRVLFPGGEPATRLEGYMVTFESTGEPRVSASGVVQADGTFQVGTYRERDGAVLGKHRVALTPPLPYTDSPPIRSRILAKYEKFDTSGLEVTITRGRNAVTLEVEPVKR